jgi:hypothetical protein
MLADFDTSQHAPNSQPEVGVQANARHLDLDVARRIARPKLGLGLSSATTSTGTGVAATPAVRSTCKGDVDAGALIADEQRSAQW